MTRRIHSRLKGTSRPLLALLVIMLGMGSAAAAGFHDPFTGRMNPHYWSSYDWGGPYALQERGRVLLAIPADSQGESFVAGYEGLPTARGDFDVQIDYALPLWPGSSGVRVGLSANSVDRQTIVNVERISFGEGEFTEEPSEVYLAHLFDGIQGITATDDRSGKLRLTREGAIYSAFYWDNAADGWVLLHAGSGPEGDVFFGFSAWSHDPIFGDEPVRVTIDNFRLEADELDLPIKPVGLEAPLAKLVPEGEIPPLPRRSFPVGRTLPIKLKLLIAGRPVTADDVSAPEIVALFRGGVKLDLAKLDLDGGKPGHDLHLRSAGRKWLYNLSTEGLAPGTYAIVLRMPDDRRYSARFVLRKRRR